MEYAVTQMRGADRNIAARYEASRNRIPKGQADGVHRVRWVSRYSDETRERRFRNVDDAETFFHYLRRSKEILVLRREEKNLRGRWEDRSRSVPSAQRSTRTRR